MAACCRMTNLLHPSFVLLVFYHLLDSFNDKQTNSDVHLLMESACHLSKYNPDCLLFLSIQQRSGGEQAENVFCVLSGQWVTQKILLNKLFADIINYTFKQIHVPI